MKKKHTQIMVFSFTNGFLFAAQHKFKRKYLCKPYAWHYALKKRRKIIMSKFDFHKNNTTTINQQKR